MTFDEFREGMNAFWETANRRAKELKDPIDALERTAAMYSRLEREDRDHADRVFDEWLLSDDEAKRYVAVALIREFRAATACGVRKPMRHAAAVYSWMSPPRRSRRLI